MWETRLFCLVLWFRFVLSSVLKRESTGWQIDVCLSAQLFMLRPSREVVIERLPDAPEPVFGESAGEIAGAQSRQA